MMLEAPYRGHHWEPAVCPLYIERGMYSTQMGESKTALGFTVLSYQPEKKAGKHTDVLTVMQWSSSGGRTVNPTCLDQLRSPHFSSM